MTKEHREYGEKILREWGEARRKINQIQQEINLLKSNINPLTSSEFEAENSEIKDTYKKVLNKYLKEMYSVMLEFKKVDTVLNNMPIEYKKVIILKYQKKYTWQKVAMESNMCKTHCFNIKNKVIDMLIEGGENENIQNNTKK